ncbi:MAG TPA: DUF2723 domain-containing protein [Gemmatimonadales bacterium]|nr:DUF2723 domain-containing protein [Gemmatimonadales bacterium]
MTNDRSAILAERPPYLMATLVALGTLVLYIVTLAPTTQFWDTSEFITAAYDLGIPHPPGNPLFSLMAHVWAMIPFYASYAARINLFVALASAGAAGFFFLVSERWLRAFVPTQWPRRIAALAGSICGATAFTVWNQSIVNEHVYTLAVCSIALTLWLIVRWDDQPAGESHDHHLLFILYLLALTATNHMLGVLAGSVVMVYLFPPLRTERPASEPERRLEWSQFFSVSAVFLMVVGLGLEGWKPLIFFGLCYVAALIYAMYAGNARFALVALGVALAGVSVYIFLPIRAVHYPGINEGEATTWNAFWDVIHRVQYGKPPITFRQATLPAQVGMWIQYFSWQWGHDWSREVQRGLAVIFAFLATIGAVRHWRADKRSAAAMTTLMFTLTVALIFYLNFKYGFSQYPDRQLAREVRERDYFYIASFAAWGIWVAMGIATLMEWLQEGLAERVPDVARRWAAATPLAAVALIPLWGNHVTASRAGETLARDFAWDILQSVEPYGILVTAGDNDTFPLWYAQEVEGVRQDVTVLNLSLANTPWYLKQLQRRPLATFDPSKAPSIYRGREWPKPTTPLFHWTALQMDSLQLAYPLDKPTLANLGKIQVTLDPQLIGHPWLEQADIAVLTAIQDHLGSRPVTFSRTVGAYADQFNLTGYLEGQGFVRKLSDKALVPNDSIQLVPQLGFVNVNRTASLLFEVYHAHTAARQRPHGWIDRPSEGILTLYGLTFEYTAPLLQKTNPALAARALAVQDSIFRNTSQNIGGPPELR